VRVRVRCASALDYCDRLPPCDDWADGLASVRAMLDATSARPFELVSEVSRWFFGQLHAAHVHLYEPDVPVDSEQAERSSGSVASAQVQDLRTEAGGLYVAFNSPMGMLVADSIIDHERAQGERPRILVALTKARRGDDARPLYSPLIPLPTTLTTGELHPWHPAMHSTRIPFALRADAQAEAPAAAARVWPVGTDADQAANMLLYLQPRYSQCSPAELARASCSSEHSADRFVLVVCGVWCVQLGGSGITTKCPGS
jgi:hypothetical protein